MHTPLYKSKQPLLTKISHRWLIGAALSLIGLTVVAALLGTGFSNAATGDPAPTMAANGGNGNSIGSASIINPTATATATATPTVIPTVTPLPPTAVPTDTPNPDSQVNARSAPVEVTADSGDNQVEPDQQNPATTSIPPTNTVEPTNPDPNKPNPNQTPKPTKTPKSKTAKPTPTPTPEATLPDDPTPTNKPRSNSGPGKSRSGKHPTATPLNNPTPTPSGHHGRHGNDDQAGG
jgi:hypothetical protein